MGIFERYLTLWVALCIVAGIALGHWLPGLFHAIGSAGIRHASTSTTSGSGARDKTARCIAFSVAW